MCLARLTLSLKIKSETILCLSGIRKTNETEENTDVAIYFSENLLQNDMKAVNK